MGIDPVKSGEIASIVTILDMREKPKPTPMPASPLRLKQWQPVDTEKYRKLFIRVGAPWLWFSRLALTDDELATIINDENIAVYAIEDPKGIEVGMLELDFREAGQCEIGYIGLVPELIGKGQGKWLVAQALTLAWRADIERVHLHTCSLDHPGALGFYRAAGFTAHGRAIETCADPRLTGLLPRDCSPQTPLIEN